ncbi:hypothetical protein ABER23_04845 [Paenibacillus lautus]|uniref:hypothetical protein n=1 Tax=Paenibacillus lautus TaxID=1401 RepID=UPI003D2DCB56
MSKERRRLMGENGANTRKTARETYECPNIISNHCKYINTIPVTSTVLQELINNLKNLDNYIERLSFVGLSAINEWRLKRSIKKAGVTLKISYYSDPEEAKTWLVSEK